MKKKNPLIEFPLFTEYSKTIIEDFYLRHVFRKFKSIFDPDYEKIFLKALNSLGTSRYEISLQSDLLKLEVKKYIFNNLPLILTYFETKIYRLRENTIIKFFIGIYYDELIAVDGFPTNEILKYKKFPNKLDDDSLSYQIQREFLKQLPISIGWKLESLFILRKYSYEKNENKIKKI